MADFLFSILFIFLIIFLLLCVVYIIYNMVTLKDREKKIKESYRKKSMEENPLLTSLYNRRDEIKYSLYWVEGYVTTGFYSLSVDIDDLSFWYHSSYKYGGCLGSNSHITMKAIGIPKEHPLFDILEYQFKLGIENICNTRNKKDNDVYEEILEKLNND